MGIIEDSLKIQVRIDRKLYKNAGFNQSVTQIGWAFKVV